jgi:hypothetical protein
MLPMGAYDFRHAKVYQQAFSSAMETFHVSKIFRKKKPILIQIKSGVHQEVFVPAYVRRIVKTIPGTFCIKSIRLRYEFQNRGPAGFSSGV